LQSLSGTSRGKTFSVRSAWAIFWAVVRRPRRPDFFFFRGFLPRASCRFSSARSENGSSSFFGSSGEFVGHFWL